MPELAGGRHVAIHATKSRPSLHGSLGTIYVRNKPGGYRTHTGKVLTNADVEAPADEAEGPIDVESLRKRPRGRPLLGPAPAEVFAVGLDPDLRAVFEARARAEQTTPSDIVRRALPGYFG